jgi:hypothetical protein
MRSCCAVIRLAIALALALGGFSCKLIREGGKAEQISRELYEELKALPVPPTAELIVEEPFAKWGRATAAAKFSTRSTWDSIRFFYRNELTKRGWKLAGTRIDRDWGRDAGARAEIYCRGGFEAELDWGETNVKEWTYALTLIWTTNVSPCHSNDGGK